MKKFRNETFIFRINLNIIMTSKLIIVMTRLDWYRAVGERRKAKVLV